MQSLCNGDNIKLLAACSDILYWITLGIYESTANTIPRTSGKVLHGAEIFAFR